MPWSEPEQLGELRGKVGWLATGAAKQERANAKRAADALPGSLTRIGTAEGCAERAYRGSVDAHRAADATGIPRLSPAAETAINALRVAPHEKARGEVCATVQKDKRVVAEIGAFRTAVMQRFGDEGVRQMLRTGERPGEVNMLSVAPGQQPALDQVAELVTTLRRGKWASASLAQREIKQEVQSQRRGLRP